MNCSEKYKYKGKEYEVQTGPRGGLFFIDDNGKRHSVKSDKPKKKVTKEKKSEKVDPSKKVLPQITPKLKRYVCYYEKRNEKDELVDDFKEWCDAYSYEEAEREFKDRYSDKIQISLITRERD